MGHIIMDLNVLCSFALLFVSITQKILPNFSKNIDTKGRKQDDNIFSLEAYNKNGKGWDQYIYISMLSGLFFFSWNLPELRSATPISGLLLLAHHCHF